MDQRKDSRTFQGSGILQSALLGTGAAAGHSHSSAAPASAASASASEAWKTLLFDAHQSEMVTILWDLIIPATDTPGAKQAGVTAYIDLILGDAAGREEFLRGLGRGRNDPNGPKEKCPSVLIEVRLYSAFRTRSAAGLPTSEARCSLRGLPGH